MSEECGQGAIIVAVSSWLGLPSGEFHMVELVLGKELFILGIVVLFRVHDILSGYHSIM